MRTIIFAKLNLKKKRSEKDVSRIVLFFFNLWSSNFTKWSNTLKQIVGKLPTNCLSVLDHFVKLALKGLRNFPLIHHINTVLVWLSKQDKMKSWSPNMVVINPYVHSKWHLLLLASLVPLQMWFIFVKKAWFWYFVNFELLLHINFVLLLLNCEYFLLHFAGIFV